MVPLVVPEAISVKNRGLRRGVLRLVVQEEGALAVVPADINNSGIGHYNLYKYISH